ncbi:unannotated protein [freshwater metagenome]|uniref:Unannotated protein n=1 Tax=freshwater metagenome TaxID=449393 RepID=A0A6J7CXS1_9ZZZZ|nr:EamA family transporter [Actinomycetota bacterium]
MHRRDLAAYGTLAIVWGLSFIVVLKASRAFGWAGSASFRALVAGSAMLVVAGVTRRRLDFSGGWRPFAVVGATTVAGQQIGLSFAAPRIGTAMVAIFVSTIPLFSMVIAQLWGLERMTPRGRVGLFLGVCGTALLVGFPSVPVTGAFLLGCCCSLGGSLAAAFGSNYAVRHLSGVGAWELTAGSFLFGGLLILPVLLFVPVPTSPRPVDYLYVVLLGVVMSAMAYVLYFQLVGSIGATKAISVEFAVTAIAVLAGPVLLHEHLTIVQLVGGAVIVGGCSLVLGFGAARTNS